MFTLVMASVLMVFSIFIYTLGGVSGCMTDERCSSYHSQAQTALTQNNLTEYCKFRSKSIACYAFDTTGCSNPEELLDTMKTGYYNTCSLTGEDVKACEVKTLSCTSHLSKAMDSLSNTDIPGYCSAMEPFLSCVTSSMSTCNTKVTIYDVLGANYATYDRFCGSPSISDKLNLCQAEIFKEGCLNFQQNMSDAMTNMNMAEYCRLFKSYTDCADRVLSVKCDPSVEKSDVMPPSGVDQICGNMDSPLQACRIKAYPCYAGLARLGNTTMETMEPAKMCSIMKNYVDCVTNHTKTCDASVKPTDVVGPMQAGFNMLCGGAAGGYCPAMATCMQSMMQMGPKGSQKGPRSRRSLNDQGPQRSQGTPYDVDREESMIPENPDIMGHCKKMEDLMSCMDTEIKACNFTLGRNYDFKDVSELFASACRVIASNPELLQCSEMDKCMKSLSMSEDPLEMSRLYYDPQFWCSMLKSTMSCAENSRDCKDSNPGQISSLLSEVNQLCPEAPLLVNVKTGSGHTIRASLLLVFISLFMTLRYKL